MLRLLLAVSLALPTLLFVVVSWREYRDAIDDARRELMRSSEVAREHAAKIFDGQSQFADRVTDLVHDMDTASITRSEKSLHDAFNAIIARVPPVQSVLLVDRSGRPLVSASVYPVPRNVDVRDRDYFKAILEEGLAGFVSRPQIGVVNPHLFFFGLSSRWIGVDGVLRGVVNVAVSPVAFADFYRILVQEGDGGETGKVIALVRNDGQILARYPQLAGGGPKPAANVAFLAAIADHPDEGTYEGQAMADPARPYRLFAYRAVEGYPVYIVAGRSRDAILAGWWRTMAGHLAFGIPATLALVAVTWTAMVRTRREERALALARHEIERRQQAEAILLRTQRLEAVGQITGGVAHDFNNLLTVILGSAELILKRPDDPARVQRVVDQILVACRRGGEIIQKLLAFSGNQSVRPEIVDLNERLADFKPLLDRAAQDAILVELRLDPELPPVRLDPGQFEAALLNLVGNARDAMPRGGTIVITTSTLETSTLESGTLESGTLESGTFEPDVSDGVARPDGAQLAGGGVRVAVADCGSGMDPQTAAKAFEPFFTTKEVGRGTGLGLSQVYGFARQAGGDVRIDTAPGRGTIVEILLPRADLARTERPGGRPAGRLETANASCAAMTSGPPAAARTVLVVEDEPELLDVTVEILGELGYATLTAGSARAALEWLRSGQRIDLLFSDVVMSGGMNGVQLAAEARRLRPGLKILLASGYVAGGHPDPDSAIPLLTKPYDRAQLAASIEAALADSGAYATLRGVV